MKIHLINNQKKYKIESNNILKVIESLCQNLKQTKKSWDEISIIIVDNNKIKKLHKKYFNKNTITDVITFSYSPIPGENKFSADIVINIDLVYKEGLIRNNIDYELAFYIAHGIDHLNGNNDNSYLKRQEMHNREKKWLLKLEKNDLLKNLIS